VFFGLLQCAGVTFSSRDLKSLKAKYCSDGMINYPDAIKDIALQFTTPDQLASILDSADENESNLRWKLRSSNS
jgi:hypothetical protein